MDRHEFARRLDRARTEYARLRQGWQAGAARWHELAEQYAQAKAAGPPTPDHSSPSPPVLARASERSSRRVGSWPSLTPLSRRELEVAALLADGRTNRQIAAALVVTEGTAANHVRRILQKLGLGCRAQVAVWFVRRQESAEVEQHVTAA